MKRRLYYILPDMQSAKQAEDDLLLSRLGIRNIRFLAKRGTSLEGLHEGSFFQKSDIVHSAQTGLLVGGGIGILAGMLLVNFGGVAQFQFRLVTILIMAIVTALLGAWASSMIGVSTPNSRLKMFDQEMADGHVLMMVDVPKGRIGEVHHLLQETHPEAVNKGSESSIPAFP